MICEKGLRYFVSTLVIFGPLFFGTMAFANATTKSVETEVETETEAEIITEVESEIETYVIIEAEKEVTTEVETEVETETEPETQVYARSDVYLLAQIVYAEAGGCSKDEMAKTGKVVINRVNTDYWEFAKCKTIEDVLYQKGSYPDTVRKIRNGLVPSQDALEVAKALLNGTIETGLSDEVFWQTGFKPSWNATVVLKTEWHYYSVLT